MNINVNFLMKAKQLETKAFNVDELAKAIMAFWIGVGLPVSRDIKTGKANKLDINRLIGDMKKYMAATGSYNFADLKEKWHLCRYILRHPKFFLHKKKNMHATWLFAIHKDTANYNIDEIIHGGFSEPEIVMPYDIGDQVVIKDSVVGFAGKTGVIIDCPGLYHVKIDSTNTVIHLDKVDLDDINVVPPASIVTKEDAAVFDVKYYLKSRFPTVTLHPPHRTLKRVYPAWDGTNNFLHQPDSLFDKIKGDKLEPKITYAKSQAKAS